MNVKPVLVLDATPVIHFAKIGKLGLLPRIGEIVIVEEVYSETALRDYPDAILVRALAAEGALRVYKVEDRGIVEALLRYRGVHLGEAETLAAAKMLGGLAVVDDAVARAVAKVHGIDVASGTLFILFRLLASGVVNVKEADEVLSQFVKQGLFLDSRTLLRAREKLKEFEK